MDWDKIIYNITLRSAIGFIVSIIGLLVICFIEIWGVHNDFAYNLSLTICGGFGILFLIGIVCGGGY